MEVEFGRNSEVIYTEVNVDGGKVAYLTLNRPEKKNALSLEMLNALCDAMDEASKPEIRAVVLKGAGNCFSAGHDLREIAEGDETFVRTIFESCYRLMRKIRQIPKPVVAQVHGYAVAAGCQIVAACDMAFASEDAKFSLPGVKIGLFCATPLAIISRVIGRKKAFEMAFTGEIIDAFEAEKIGLINRVVKNHELDSEVRDVVGKLSKFSRSVIEKGKEFFYKQYCMNEFDAILYGIDVIVDMCGEQAAREGISSFLEKRKSK
ncbi:MAG: enoyl-CoA hydratase [Archaeoglobus sp.]|jgi:enoyl-CoA hydratase/carnithine racemase|nr:MAG: enoyl-CoA hydratase [Archaeoglobus sp.]